MTQGTMPHAPAAPKRGAQGQLLRGTGIMRQEQRIDQLEERIPAQGKGTQEILSESLQTLERAAEGSNHAPHHRPIFQLSKGLQRRSLNSKLKSYVGEL